MLSKERHQTATGPDTISGEGGGEGNDVLFGHTGEGTALSGDASPLSLNINNLRSDTSSGSNNA